MNRVTYKSTYSFWKTGLLRCNLHTIQFSHLKCTIHLFLVYSQISVTITIVNFRTVPSPHSERLYPLAVTTQSPLTLSHLGCLKQPLISFLSLQIFIFQTFYMDGIIQHVVFCDWLFSFGIKCSRFICCSICQYFITFYG